MAINPFYQELEHTADWAIRVWGKTLSALFEHAASAMFELQGAPMNSQTPLEAQVSCSAHDLESLLVAWLNELLFLSETHDLLFTRFTARIEAASEGDMGLQAHVKGVPGRGPMAHIKAATYYDLKVNKTPKGWEATITFDT
jgi:SHS2 domain-containing protein